MAIKLEERSSGTASAVGTGDATTVGSVDGSAMVETVEAERVAAVEAVDVSAMVETVETERVAAVETIDGSAMVETVEAESVTAVEAVDGSATVETVEAERVIAVETIDVSATVKTAEAQGVNDAEAVLRCEHVRYRLLDVARGVTLINMIAYHLLYDLVYIFGVELPWYTSSVGYVWQQAICWTFIFISGISCNFSRGNMARGARLLLFGAAMTVVTMVAMPEQLVVFGVLSFLGCAGIIYAVLEKPLKKVPAVAGFVVSATVFLATKGVPSGFVGMGDIPLIRLPDGWYNIYAMFPLGFPSSDFYSSDYFSIIPWIFLYFAGFYLWRAIKNHSVFELSGAGKLPLLELIGRNTLPIYLLHQPIIYGALWLIFRL